MNTMPLHMLDYTVIIHQLMLRTNIFTTADIIIFVIGTKLLSSGSTRSYEKSIVLSWLLEPGARKSYFKIIHANRYFII